MHIKDLKDCEEIIAGDNTILRELLQPNKEELPFRYSLAHAVVKPGNTSKPHKMKTSEVCYILEGEGIMYTDDESVKVSPGQAVSIPPNATQYISNTGDVDLKFLCIVDPAWKPEDEVVL